MSRFSRQSQGSEGEGSTYARAGETTSITLNESWSGYISVGDQGQPSRPKKSSFTLSLWSFAAKGRVKGIIFRNKQPMQTVTPAAFGVYATNRDALRSLQSLDHKLQREYAEDMNFATGSSRAASFHSTHSDLSTVIHADRNSPAPSMHKNSSAAYSVPKKTETRQQRTHLSGGRTPQYLRDSTLYDAGMPNDLYRSRSVSSLSQHQAALNNYVHHNHEDVVVTPRRPLSVSSIVSTGSHLYDDVDDCNKAESLSRLQRSSSSLRNERESTEEEDQALYLSQSISGRIYSLKERHAWISNDEMARNLKERGTYSRYCSDEELWRVGEAVIRLGDGDGQKRNMAFQNVVRRICDVINVILSGLPHSLFPFQFERLGDGVHFETKGLRAIELYLCPARVNYDQFEVNFFQRNTMMADMFVKSERKDIEHFFVEDPVTRRKRLSPCKMMIVFAHVLKASLKERNIYSIHSRKRYGYELPHGADILFSMITERLIQLNLKFPEEVSPYEVTLVLALDINKFPDCTNMSSARDWPSNSVKRTIDQEGVHLLAKLGDRNLHSWTISTLKARRTLLRLTDLSGNKLRLLLAFQTLRETELSRPRLLLPLHLANVLFWACMKFPSAADWTDDRAGLRFLDLLLALRRCLWRGECRDFFFPFSNLFESKTPDVLHAVASKLDNILKTPLKFLRRRVMVSDGEGDE